MRTLVIVAMLGMVGGCGKKQTTDSATAAPTDVDVGTLVTAYKANEVRADAAYKGKRVRVKGIVGDVKKDITDSMYVTIGNGGDFELQTVHCQVSDKQVQAASALDKGNTVTVTGTVNGLILTSVILKDCEIGASSKPPAPPAGAAAEKACAALEKGKVAKECKREESDAGPGFAVYSFKLTNSKHGGLITEYPDDATYSKMSAKIAANPKLASCDDAPHRLVLILDPSASVAEKVGPCMWLTMAEPLGKP